jgi:hypothetical protein
MADEELSVGVKLASFGEADALKQILEEEQIPYRERRYQDTAFDGIGLAMHQQTGWGELWVRAEDEARVNEALTAIRDAVAAAPAPAPPPPEEPGVVEERSKVNLRGLWLLIAVVVGIVVIVIISALLGGNRCDEISDPLKREQCVRDRANVSQPRDWR